MKSSVKKACEVCGFVTSPVCYKLYICSSCRIFYRRNFHLWGKIDCQNNEACNLFHGGRRSCQYCRLKALRNNGLRMAGKSLIVQENGHPVDDVPEQTAVEKETTPRISNQRSNSINNEEILSKYPFLQRVVQTFKQFYERQILMSTVELQEELINDSAENSKLMGKLEFNQMEQKILILACNTVVDLLNELPNLSNETRMRVIKQTVLDVSIVLKSYLTCLRYPEIGDLRMALFTGYHFVTMDCRTFLSGLPEEIIERAIKIYEPLMKRCCVSLDRLRHAKLSFNEFAVVLAFSVYESVDKDDNVDRQKVFDLRDKLASELSAYLSNFYTAHEVSLRFARLFASIHDIKHCNEFYVDTHTISNVFMSDYPKELYSPHSELSENYIKNLATLSLD